MSFPYMGIKHVKYYAADVSPEDMLFIQSYFDKMGIDGETFAMDLTDSGDFPEVDVCFMFKLLDTLETIKRGISEELVKSIKANWIVASFPTKTLGGKKTISKNRLVWFKKIISAYEYEMFEVENEIFYVINKRI